MKSILFYLIILIYPFCALAQDDVWSGSTAFSFNKTSGNSDNALLGVDILLERKAGKNEFRSTAAVAYGKTDSETSEDNGNVSAQYNRLLKPKTYGYFNADLEYNDIARIDYRAIVGPGAGHYLIKNDEVLLSLEIGASYLSEKLSPLSSTNLVESADDADLSDDLIAIRALERFEFKLSDAARIIQQAEYLPEVSDLDVYLLNVELAVEAQLNATLSLRIVLQDQYDNAPALGIEKNDVIIKSSLVYNL